MKYRYRWFYFLLISAAILLFGFFYILKPDLVQMRRLNKIEKHLSQTLVKVKRIATPANSKSFTMISNSSDRRPYLINERLSDQISLMDKYGLILQSLMFLSSEDNHLDRDISIRLTLEGDFTNIIAYLLMLDQYKKSEAFILDFSFKPLQANRFILTMDMLLLTYALQAMNNDLSFASTKAINNPFCNAHHLFASRSSNVEQAQAFWLNQIKMIGYLHQGQRSQALVSLPNNMIVSVAIGSILGKEQSRVISILRDQLISQLPNGKRWVLHI